MIDRIKRDRAQDEAVSGFLVVDGLGCEAVGLADKGWIFGIF
jgi:hypothetical protein